MIPFDSGRWDWGGAEPTPARHRGRDCVRLESPLATVAGLEPVDGTIELELAVGPERAFPGVVWRVQGGSYESFFVRPHQVGKPDAIQYTPAFNGISAWQLYHGTGFWSPISFPLDEWFRIRVVFAEARADMYVADMDEPALQVRELKLPVGPGRIGVAAAGASVYVAGFSYDPGGTLTPEPPPLPAVEGIVPAWRVSDAFPEAGVAGEALDPALLAARTWTPLSADPSGLADLARVNGIHGDRNTALARTLIRSDRARSVRVDFGFSDRAVVYLGGRALYRGNAGYRTRDYRFLGSIGYWDAVYLPLEEGDNELVVAVSEDFGGWGVQARFPDAAGLTFS